MSFFSTTGLSHASAQEATVLTLPNDNILSNGQFVYGPNIGDFIIKTYLEKYAPHLLMYADDLYERSEYYSINPQIYLTLLEIHSHLLSNPNIVLLRDAFGLNDGDFISQVEVLSDKMSEAYYLHLYSYSPLPVPERYLPSFVTSDGVTINVAPDTNAGTYAIIAGLSAMNEQNISLLVDNSQINGFYQTYRRLFGNNDPLDEKNKITTLTENAGLLAAPNNLLQLPYLRGLSWRFGGVHNASGGTTFTDASSLDFYPWPIAWGADTSNMWVVAAASGIPTRFSDCGYKISHSGAVNIGWETVYYHLEGAKYLSGQVDQNEKIGVIANTEAEATCTGGAASAPHVHFSLKYNGAYVAINGTPLSGWYVHSGRYSYDVDPNYMWLARAGQKKYSYSDVVLSDNYIPGIFVDVPFDGFARAQIETIYNAGITGGCSALPLNYCPQTAVTRSQMAVFLERGIHGTLYNPPAVGGSTIFADVQLAYWAGAWIKQLATEGITGGCGSGDYCPESPVTRAQMAVFLLRSKYGASYNPPPVEGSTGFTDVDPTYWAGAWIKQLVAEGITAGCGAGAYCPESPVTRAQMAVFLVRTFNLP
jgi:LasA protease